MKKVLLIGCIMVFIFCAPKKTTVETEGVEEVIVFGEEEALVSEEPVLPEPVEEEAVMPPPAEGEIAPPVIEEEVVAPPIEEEIAVIPPPTQEPVVMTPPVTERPVPPTAQILGFRVQIFASSTEKNASKVADDARTTLDENVYVDHIVPYYKVRIGDCLTREDAEFLKDKALRQGYTGAFVVETMIRP